MEPIILASGSLRRQEYFRLLGLPFNIMPARSDETYSEGLSLQEIAQEVATRKVRNILNNLRGCSPPWICGADTIISLDGQIYGKPADREEARQMLRALQGREHEVVTAVVLYKGRDKSLDHRAVTSTVTFAPISEEEIEWYLNTGEWQGAAGSYKIQGLAACFIAHIQGSYSSVVGLPLHEFYGMLRENGYPYGG